MFLPEDCGKTTGGMCLKKKCHKPWACRWSNRWVRGTWCSFKSSIQCLLICHLLLQLKSLILLLFLFTIYSCFMLRQKFIKRFPSSRNCTSQWQGMCLKWVYLRVTLWWFHGLVVNGKLGSVTAYSIGTDPSSATITHPISYGRSWQNIPKMCLYQTTYHETSPQLKSIFNINNDYCQEWEVALTMLDQALYINTLVFIAFQGK